MWHFPIMSDGPVVRAPREDWNPIERYRLRWTTNCHIISPFNGYTRMYRVRGQWSISFRPRWSGWMPSVSGWVAPALSEMRVRVEGHEINPESVAQSLFGGRESIPITRRDERGRPARPTVFSTRGPDSAATFVRQHWDAGHATGLEAPAGTTAYRFPTAMPEGEVFAWVEILYSAKTDPARPPEPAFYFRARQLFLRLAAAGSLEMHDTPSLEYRSPPADALALAALENPFDAYLTSDTSEFPSTPDVIVVGGLQRMKLHLPFSVGDVTIPPEVLVISEQEVPVAYGAGAVLAVEPVPLVRDVAFTVRGTVSGGPAEERLPTGAGRFPWSTIDRYRPSDRRLEYAILLGVAGRTYSLPTTSSAIPRIRGYLRDARTHLTNQDTELARSSGYPDSAGGLIPQLSWYDLIPLYTRIRELQERGDRPDPYNLADVLPPSEASRYRRLQTELQGFDRAMRDLATSLRSVFRSPSWRNDIVLADRSVVRSTVQDLFQTMSGTFHGDALIEEIFGEMLIAAERQTHPDLATLQWTWWVATTAASVEAVDDFVDLLCRTVFAAARRELKAGHPLRDTVAAFNRKLEDLDLRIVHGGRGPGTFAISGPPTMRSLARVSAIVSNFLAIGAKVEDYREGPSLTKAVEIVSAASDFVSVTAELVSAQPLGMRRVVNDLALGNIERRIIERRTARLMTIARIGSMANILGAAVDAVSSIVTAVRLMDAREEEGAFFAGIGALGSLLVIIGILAPAPVGLPVMIIGEILFVVGLIGVHASVRTPIQRLIANTALGVEATDARNPLHWLAVPIAGQVQLIDSLAYPVSITVDYARTDRLAVILEASLTDVGAPYLLRLFASHDLTTSSYGTMVAEVSGQLFSPPADDPPRFRHDRPSHASTRSSPDGTHEVETWYNYDGSARIGLYLDRSHLSTIRDMRMEAYVRIAPFSPEPRAAIHLAGFTARGDSPALLPDPTA